jgi:translation initiation factor 6 (eIF-6)
LLSATEAALAADQAAEDVVEEADHQLRVVVIRTCVKAAVAVGAAMAIARNARFAVGMATPQIGASTGSMKTSFPTQDTML